MSTSKYEAHGVIDPVTKSPSDEDEVAYCDPYWCPCPVCQKRMNAQRLPAEGSESPSYCAYGSCRVRLFDPTAKYCDCHEADIAMGLGPEEDTKSPSDQVDRLCDRCGEPCCGCYAEEATLKIIQEDFDYYQGLRARSYARSWMADRLHNHVGTLLDMLENK